MQAPQPQEIAVLGADRGAVWALLCALAPRLQGTPFAAQAWLGARAGQCPPALVLLLATADAQHEAQELRWREALAREGTAFSVLHGADAQALLDDAWRLIAPLLGLTPLPDPLAAPKAGWTWTCEKCSDPACEHRLFQDLLQSRGPAER